jgi:flagellar basal body-associated protein FliL
MNKKLIIIIVAILVVGGGVTAFFLLRGGDEEEAPDVRMEYLLEEAFVVNVKDAMSLLKCTVTVVFNTDTIPPEELVLMQARMYDSVLRALRDCNEEELKAIDLNPVKAKIIQSLNETFEFESVVDILFSGYAVQ